MDETTGSGALVLDDRDQAVLHGEHGEGAALAMRILVAMARASGARRFVDIESAHVDACIYVGPVSIEVAERLVDGGATVSVPATLNVGSVDLLHPELWRGEPEAAAHAREVMALYRSLGCRATWTCAPYQLPNRPELGAQVAWGESNAIVFANSVLGARTQRYGDFVDIAAAIVGRVPLAGLHRDENRRAQVVVDVSGPGERWRGRDELFPLLGFAMGQVVGDQIPVIAGLDDASEDQLRALGAASASSGAVAMFHVAGVTPEAPTLADALGGSEPQRTVTIDESHLRAAWEKLSTQREGRLGAVCLGTPHASARELARLANLLNGRQVHEATPLYVNTGRDVLRQVDDAGIGDRLRASGVVVVTDTCTYNTPVMARVDGLVMTDSAKWAWYGPRNIQVQTLFAGMESCVESAVKGQVTHDALF